MRVITGAAGFIGSCLVSQLNSIGITNLILVDDFSSVDKNKNLQGKFFDKQIDRVEFLEWFPNHVNIITEVYHIGARTDTTEFNIEVFQRLNLNF